MRDATVAPLHFARSTIPEEIIEGLPEIYLSKDQCSFEKLSKVAFDWEIRMSDLTIESEIQIQKRISPPRNLSLWWISIKKSKSGFHGFPFYRSIGESEKGFAKLFSWTVVFFLLIMRQRARASPLFLRTVYQILFRISQKDGKKGNPRTDISALRNYPLLDFAFDYKSGI